jgi:hypothetical protein
MKVPYYCPYCDQRSTRRWNLQVHIKRKHGGSPGPYLASHQFSYEPTNPYHNIESNTVADNGCNSFQPRYGLQQAPLGTSQYFTSPAYPPHVHRHYGYHGHYYRPYHGYYHGYYRHYHGHGVYHKGVTVKTPRGIIRMQILQALFLSPLSSLLRTLLLPSTLQKLKEKPFKLFYF